MTAMLVSSESPKADAPTVQQPNTDASGTE